MLTGSLWPMHPGVHTSTPGTGPTTRRGRGVTRKAFSSVTAGSVAGSFTRHPPRRRPHKRTRAAERLTVPFRGPGDRGKGRPGRRAPGSERRGRQRERHGRRSGDLGPPGEHGARPRVRRGGAAADEAYPHARAAARIGLHRPDVDPPGRGTCARRRTAPGRTCAGPNSTTASPRYGSREIRRDTVGLNLDHAQHGLGSASCGPGVLPEHRLTAEPAAFAFVLSARAA